MATDHPVSVAYCNARKNNDPSAIAKKKNPSIRKLDNILVLNCSEPLSTIAPMINNTNPNPMAANIVLLAFDEI